MSRLTSETRDSSVVSLVNGKETARVIVCVLGDTGRSPRMQYHALSFAKLGYAVTLIGYTGEPCIPDVQKMTSIQDRRLHVPELPTLLRRVPLLPTAWKAISVLFHMFFIFVFHPKADLILVQNPPCIPVIAAAVLADLLLVWRHSRIVIDWHNLGYTMFQEKLGKSHILVFITLVLETIFAHFCDLHWAVSKAMSSYVHQFFRIKEKPQVLYDRPHGAFVRSGSTIEQRHSLLMKLGYTVESLFPGSGRRDGEVVGTISTIQTRVVHKTPRSKPRVELRKDDSFVPIVISSTSWTPDEDFSILLNALLAIEARVKDTRKRNKILVCITGKGPMKESFEQTVAKHCEEGRLGTHVAVRTIWLEPQDYPIFMGCATLGVCLHTSTSGLDLPMKVLDMFGSGLPVCAVHFETLPELIQHDSNGLIFKIDDDSASYVRPIHPVTGRHSEQLVTQLLHCLFDLRPSSRSRESGSDVLQRLKQEAMKISSWDENWDDIVPSVLLGNCRNTQKIRLPYILRFCLKGVFWSILLVFFIPTATKEAIYSYI